MALDRAIAHAAVPGARQVSLEKKQPEEPTLVSGRCDPAGFEDGDPENPLNWRPRKKWPIVILVSLMNTLGVIATTTIVPAVPQALAEFGVSGSPVYQVLLVSIWELGEGVGPFFIGPLSERFGRLRVYHAGNALGLIFAAAGAMSTSSSMLVAMRFLNGCTMTALTLAPAVVGDLFVEEERGSAMAVAMGLRVIGAFLAPIAGSSVAQALGWRWTIWIVVLGMAAVAALSLVFLRETYAPAILERCAACSGRLRSERHARLSVTRIAASFSRPARMLCLSPAVFIVSFYTALAYGMSYLILTTLTEIMESRYGFSRGTVGLAFLGPVVGNLLGMLFYGLTSDRYVRRKKHQEGGVLRPEHRLAAMVLAGAVMPLGLLLYGWTLAYQVHWMVPLVGAAVVGFSVVLSLLPTENYLVDLYKTHAASAIAAGVILRAFFGALFPLVGPSLYSRIGLGWGNSVLALVSLAMMPMLILLWRCGERLRTEKLLQDG